MHVCNTNIQLPVLCDTFLSVMYPASLLSMQGEGCRKRLQGCHSPCEYSAGDRNQAHLCFVTHLLVSPCLACLAALFLPLQHRVAAFHCMCAHVGAADWAPAVCVQDYNTQQTTHIGQAYLNFETPAEGESRRPYWSATVPEACSSCLSDSLPHCLREALSAWCKQPLTVRLGLDASAAAPV